jgi:AraC-like DNA-binding protein
VEGARTVPFPLTCASGLLLGPDVIEAPPGWNAVLGIRLRPLGAFIVLDGPLEPLTGITVDLEDLADGEAPTPEARLRAAAAWVEERARAGSPPDPAVAWMSGTIEARRGDVSIRALTERTGWSRTRMHAAFRAQVGVSPKRLARIHRFRRALGLVMESAGPRTAFRRAQASRSTRSEADGTVGAVAARGGWTFFQDDGGAARYRPRPSTNPDRRAP